MQRAVYRRPGAATIFSPTRRTTGTSREPSKSRRGKPPALACPNWEFGRASLAALPPVENEMLILTVLRVAREIVTEAMALRRELRRRYRLVEE
jgi:hypothetical protein